DRLEGGRNCAATVHLVGFATVALTAELRRLVGAGGAAARVVRRADEEHRLVVAGRQTGLRTVGDLHHIHEVLVVAARARDHGVVVPGAQANEEAVVLNELGGIRAVHRDHAVGFGAIPGVLGAAGDRRIQAHRVVVEVVAGAVAVLAEQGRNDVLGSIGWRQRLIDLVPQHGALGVVAVVAAQAQGD